MDSSSPSSLTPNLRLLCLSNGHGEDIIAVRIVQELQQLCPNLKIAALPIVGEGKAYTQLGIPLIGSVKAMPSGGFVYMDGRQLLGDIQGGLLASVKGNSSMGEGTRGQRKSIKFPPLSLSPTLPLLDPSCRRYLSLALCLLEWS